MQEEEENLPGVIRRLKANEADLDAIKRNMAYLEGKNWNGPCNGQIPQRYRK